MAKSTSETGNAVNLNNFKSLTDVCVSFGADYDPSNKNLATPNLLERWQADTQKEKNYQKLVQGTRQPVAERQEVFAPLDGLVTRVLGELDSTQASDHMKALARSLGKDIRGTNTNNNGKADSGDAELDRVSQSHQSYVNKAKNFYSLIELLNTIPEYKPNKEDLTTASLLALSQTLDAENDGMEGKLTDAKKAGIEVKTALYAPNTGLVDTALACKSYVKGLYGAKDAKFKMVNGIKFKNLNRDK